MLVAMVRCRRGIDHWYNGPSPKDGGWAFSSGGDQRIRGKDGYKYEGKPGEETSAIDPTPAWVVCTFWKCKG